MSKWFSAFSGLVVPLTLLLGAPVCAAQTTGTAGPGVQNPEQNEQSLADQSERRRLAPMWRTAPGPIDRMAQHRHELDMRRRQRKIEFEALRKLRKEEREEWLKRWDEQRRHAREQSLEREHRIRRELSARYPDLAKQRERNARELERRRQEFEEERRERWQALDLLSY